MKERFDKLLEKDKSNLDVLAILEKKLLKYETQEKNTLRVTAETHIIMECEDCGYPPEDFVDNAMDQMTTMCKNQ